MTKIKSNPKRIVIIEDDGIIVTRLKNILRKFGYDCVDAIAFGEEALKKITRVMPDMILIDIRLSGKINGIEVAEQVHAKFDIPVIFLTAYSEEKLLEQAKLTEPYAYLIKPVNERELYATIELAFYRHAMETKLKKSEEELRKTHDYLENLINYANTPIIVWDSWFVITRYNHAFEHLSAYKADEVIGKRLDFLFPESNIKDSLAKIEQTSTGGHWESVEIPILRKDGELRIVLWNSAAIYAKDGNTVISTIAQGQDITKRKQAEEKLKKKMNELEIFNDAAVDRELMVNDLRKEINELLKKLGKEPKYNIIERKLGFPDESG